MKATGHWEVRGADWGRGCLRSRTRRGILQASNRQPIVLPSQHRSAPTQVISLRMSKPMKTSHIRPSRMGPIINAALQLILLMLLQTPANALAQSYRVLHYFNGTDGAYPRRLVLSGATLYGAAAYGGSSDYGTYFPSTPTGAGSPCSRISRVASTAAIRLVLY
jgi:hypothetical protein